MDSVIDELRREEKLQCQTELPERWVWYLDTESVSLVLGAPLMQ